MWKFEKSSKFGEKNPKKYEDFYEIEILWKVVKIQENIQDFGRWEKIEFLNTFENYITKSEVSKTEQDTECEVKYVHKGGHCHNNKNKQTKYFLAFRRKAKICWKFNLRLTHRISKTSI